MPHIIVEYSANLTAYVSPSHLIAEIHRAALSTGVFPIGGLRTRAECRDVFRIADGNPEHVFVAVLARIGHGRDLETRQRVAANLLEVLKRETASLAVERGIALSVDIQELDSAVTARANNLHDRVKQEAS